MKWLASSDKTEDDPVEELAKLHRRIARPEKLQARRKQREKALLGTQEHYRRLLELSPETIAVHSQGKTVYINAAGAKLLGVDSPKELTGKPIMDFVHPDCQKIIGKRIRESFEQGKKAPLIEEKLVRPDGKVIYVETTATRITYRGKPAMLAISRDITDRKKMEKRIRAYEKRLRLLACELTLVEERERRAIATELQDAVSQLLVFCKMKLAELEKIITLPESRRLLEEIRGPVEEIFQDIRSLTHQLSPLILYELGLPAALEWLTEEMYKHHAIQIDLEVDRQVKVKSEELRIFLFRAVQELLVNVTRHAETDRAGVSLYRKGENLCISVEDRGVGFDPTSLETPSDKNRRFGLFSIRERFRYFGGEFSIRSKPGHGTRVILTIPLEVVQAKKWASLGVDVFSERTERVPMA